MNKKQKIKIHPRHNWVLVKPVEKMKVSEYGLSIPDSVEKEQKSMGEVVEVGPRVEGLKKGLKVLYGKYAGEDIQFGSQLELKDRVDLTLLLDEDILAIIENE